jgi:hypothetical protein
MIDHKRSGFGVRLYADGSKYEGEWNDDKRNGKGVLKFPDGSTYTGEFKDDEMDGIGVKTNPETGEKFEGTWRNGYFEG